MGSSGMLSTSQCSFFTDRFADIIASDPETHGATFVPIVLGSDKTTVSVATGHNEYYPLHSIGNVHNGVRRAHRGAVSLVGFLSIAKSKSKSERVLLTNS